MGTSVPQLMIPWMYAAAKETVASVFADGLELNGRDSGDSMPTGQACGSLRRPAVPLGAGGEIYNPLK